MEENLNEDLKRKVIELERRLKEYEQNGADQHSREASGPLEKIAEMGDDGIIVLNQNYQIEFANTVASELTGHSKKALIGMDFRNFLCEEDWVYLGRMRSEVGIDESKRVCTEMEILTKNGLTRDTEVCITIEKVKKGGAKVYVYLRDITERKRMEREIREANKRFEKIAEMGEDGIVVFDEGSRIEFVNQKAAEIIGLSKDQILGQEFFPLIGKRGEEFVEQMIMKGEGLGQKVCMEMLMQPPGGKVKETEVCMAPAWSEEGALRMYAYVRDITEKKKFENELRESEEKYRNLFERVRHGLFISSKEGCFLDCNPVLLEMAGYQNKEELLNIDIV
jgi:PAS domain S-box-containing protein